MKARLLQSVAGLAAFLAATTTSIQGQSPDPLSPESEQASFKVLPGFEVSLFASERDGVIKPIQIRFDAAGRLWVAGSTVYPQLAPGQQPNDKILILEDTDHDGRVDRTTVFADGLMMPTGLELGDGGVYVGAGTELLHLRDTDGDGRADQRRVVVSGFGTGDTHQTVNSLTWGPSGELMMSQGLHAFSRIETPWGTEQLRQSGVWRFWPKRLRMDAFWDGAMGAHNPFGTVFDRWGQPLVLAGNGHGIYHLTPAMIRTDHFLLQASLWNQGRKFGGADVVENSHWPAHNQGELVTGGYLQNTVERFSIADRGSSFSVERLPPLIESTNTAFRIVDARFGPDGALYLCDWCNPIIGHYQTSFRHPDRDRTHGRIWRVTAKDRPWVAWTPLDKAPVDALYQALKSPERWNRQMAKHVLADRPEAEVTASLKLWGDQWVPGETARELEYFELLGLHAARESVRRDLLVKAAVAKTPGLRAFAARVTGEWAERISNPLELLERLAQDREARVRLEAVVACSYVPDARAVEVAASALDQQSDAAIQYAFTQTVHALKALWQGPYARGELKFGNVPARLAAFTQADRSADTVAIAVSRLRRVGEVALDAETQAGLLQLVADAGGPAELAVLLPMSSHSLGTNYNAGQHARFLDALVQAKRLRGIQPDGDLLGRVRPLVERGDPRVQEAALRLAGAWGLVDLRPIALASAADRTTPPSMRAAAVAAIAGFGGTEDRALVQKTAYDSTELPLVRSRAVAELARLEPTVAGPVAVEFLSVPEPDAAVTEVIEAILARPEATSAFRTATASRALNADAAKLALRTMAAGGRRDEVLAARLESAAGFLREPRRWSVAETAAFIVEVRQGGTPGPGSTIFRRPELGCTQCHGINAATLGIGPDLGALGTAQTPEFIVGAILEPQREVKEGFASLSLSLRDGEELTGRIVGEDNEHLVIHDTLTRQDIRVRKDRIADRHDIGSVMPPGLADTLTRAEFRDLVRYLMSLGRRAAE